MRKYFFIIILLISFNAYGQQSENVFDQSEDNTEQTSEKEPEVAYGIGNPGEDPVPIDDYIPLLIIVAMGMIVYNTLRKKTLS